MRKTKPNVATVRMSDEFYDLVKQKMKESECKSISDFINLCLSEKIERMSAADVVKTVDEKIQSLIKANIKIGSDLQEIRQFMETDHSSNQQSQKMLSDLVNKLNEVLA